jgi:general secretion pathway protein N
VAARPAGDASDKAWQRSQRASRRWALWGVALGASVGLLTFAPATWLARGLHSASGQRLLLADAQGSVWRGSAVAVLQGGPDSQDAAALPGRLHWSISPNWSGLTLTLRQACCLQGDVSLRITPAWQGFTLSLPAHADGLGQWPAQWLAGLGAPWNTLQLGGQLRLATSGFTLQTVAGRARLNGALDLQLLGARSRVSPVDPLGSYRLSVRSDSQNGESAALTLDTIDGALRLTGSGQWTGSRLRFRGEARAADGQDAGLSNLLNIIGRRQGALSVISIG